MIYLIDDDPDIGAALATQLAGKGYEVRTFHSARRFLESVEPDASGCVVTDVRMPDISGLDLLSKMKEARISLPVIVMTAYADVALAIEIMKHGAFDLIEKPFTGDALIAVIRTALAKSLNERSSNAELAAIRNRYAVLTTREMQVMRGILSGSANKIIAHQLGIDIRTVESVRAEVMEKMQVESVVELVRTCSRADVLFD